MLLSRKTEKRTPKHAKRHQGANIYWDENDEDASEFVDPMLKSYKLIERELQMYLNEKPGSREAFDKNIWTFLDHQDMGQTALSEVDKLINVRWPKLASTDALYRVRPLFWSFGAAFNFVSGGAWR